MERREFIESASVAATLFATAVAGCTAPRQGTEPTATTAPDEGATGETTGAGPTPTATPTTTGGGGAPDQIGMYAEGNSFYFDPVGLYVEPGETVTWTIVSGTHTSTAYDDRIPTDAEPWESGTLSQEGAEFSYTFEVAGTYDYFCVPHETLGMVGRIVCGQPGGPATQGSPPYGNLPSSETIVQQREVPWGPQYA